MTVGAQEEGGVAGDDLGIGEGADVAHLGFLSGELTVFDHLVELHTGSDAGQVTAFVNGGKRIVEIGQAFGVGLGAGGVAELHVGEFLGRLDHIVFVAEGVGKHDVAPGVGQLFGGFLAVLVLVNVGFHEVLDAQLLAGFLGGVQEVQVIGGVFVVQENEANLHLGGVSLGGGADGHQAHHHYHSQNQRKNLFHVCLSPFRVVVDGLRIYKGYLRHIQRFLNGTECRHRSFRR